MAASGRYELLDFVHTDGGDASVKYLFSYCKNVVNALYTKVTM